MDTTELRRRWSELGLTTRFGLVSALIILSGMLVLGEWVARRIAEGVVHSHAASAALYANSVVKMQVQELKNQSTLSKETLQGIDDLIRPRPIAGFRIWKNNTVVYSERKDLVGRTFPPSPVRNRALAGEVVAVYRLAGNAPSAPIVTPGEWLLEVYAPVRENGTNRIIALAETYEIASSLRTDIRNARIGSWLLTAAIGMGMLALQTAIVHGGNLTIQRQRTDLEQQIHMLSTTRDENKSLRHANDAGERASETQERFLRRVGADLHDGPLQLIAMAVLRVDSMKGLLESSEPDMLREALEDLDLVHGSLSDTMVELRNIAAGLALPEIEHHALPLVIRTAARRHERQSGLPVACAVDHPLPDVRPVIKESIYRFLQEGLSNALHHAGGRGQSIRCRLLGGKIEVSVLDEGPGIGATARSANGHGQGLTGLRYRIEALGGALSIADRSSGGTALVASFPIVPAQPEERRSNV